MLPSSRCLAVLLEKPKSISATTIEREGGAVERDEFAHSRQRIPWWQRERTKDMTVGFVLGVLAIGIVAWLVKKLGL
jgi:hypothetical protein